MNGISPVWNLFAAAPSAQDRNAAENPGFDAASAMGDRVDPLSEEDRTYYLIRAEEELELAQHSRHPKVVHSHYLLASLYLERAYGSDPWEGAEQ